jgi:hypothetical protein
MAYGLAYLPCLHELAHCLQLLQIGIGVGLIGYRGIYYSHHDVGIYAYLLHQRHCRGRVWV